MVVYLTVMLSSRNLYCIFTPATYSILHYGRILQKPGHFYLNIMISDYPFGIPSSSTQTKTYFLAFFPPNEHYVEANPPHLPLPSHAHTSVIEVNDVNFDS